MFANSPSRWSVDVGLALIRVMVGVVFVFHGSQKLFGVFGGPGMEGFAGYVATLGVPAPTLAAWLAALAEFGGGLAFILGAGTRLAAVPLVITMLVAAFGVHGSAFSVQAQGMEYALTLGVASLGLAFTGPGRFSLDETVMPAPFKTPGIQAVKPQGV